MAPHRPPRPTSAGAAHKTPSPTTPTTDPTHSHGQPVTLVGAGEPHAPAGRVWLALK